MSSHEALNNQESENFQKKQVNISNDKKQELIEEKALILFQQKFLNSQNTEPLWAIKNYPVSNGTSATSPLPKLLLRVERNFDATSSSPKITLPRETDYVIDESGFGAVSKQLNSEGYQTGFLGVDAKSSQEYFSGQSRSLDQVVAVPFKILSFVKS
ncbi:MAG: hypothetical protein ACKN9V_02295, partial [Pseudomonadota bacterium]